MDKKIIKLIFKGGDSMLVDSKFLRWNVIKSMSGNHYLVLLLLLNQQSPLKRKDIVALMTNSESKKCCISDNTLKKIIDDLLNKNFILYNNFSKQYVANTKTYNPEYIQISSLSLTAIINKEISSADLRVYLCLMKLLHSGKETTYESIAMNLGVSDNIYQNINRLRGANLIDVNKRKSKRGMWYNVYTPLFREEV